MTEEKHNKDTCPKSDTWFTEGGRCGLAWCCDNCKEMENKNDRK